MQDIFDYNIFNNFTENIGVPYILTAINNMHVYLDMSDTSQIKLENIKLNDIDNPIYFQININESINKKKEPA